MQLWYECLQEIAALLGTHCEGSPTPNPREDKAYETSSLNETLIQDEHCIGDTSFESPEDPYEQSDRQSRKVEINR
jgi:hypothetical protein